MTETLKVISPEGLPLGATGGVSRPLDTLRGKTIGEVYNNHFKGELMFQTYRRLFEEKYPGIRIIPFDQFPIVYVGGDAEQLQPYFTDIRTGADITADLRAYLLTGQQQSWECFGHDRAH